MEVEGTSKSPGLSRDGEGRRGEKHQVKVIVSPAPLSSWSVFPLREPVRLGRKLALGKGMKERAKQESSMSGEQGWDKGTGVVWGAEGGRPG